MLTYDHLVSPADLNRLGNTSRSHTAMNTHINTSVVCCDIRTRTPINAYAARLQIKCRILGCSTSSS